MIHQRVKSAFGSNQVHSINRLNFVVCLHLCCLCCVISRRADTRDLLLPLVTRNNQDCFSSLFCKQQQSKWLYPIFVTPAALEEVYVHKKSHPSSACHLLTSQRFTPTQEERWGLVQQEDNEINDEAFKPLYPSGLL
jgi:hypothetical protein